MKECARLLLNLIHSARETGHVLVALSPLTIQGPHSSGDQPYSFTVEEARQWLTSDGDNWTLILPKLPMGRHVRIDESPLNGNLEVRIEGTRDCISIPTPDILAISLLPLRRA